MADFESAKEGSQVIGSLNSLLSGFGAPTYRSALTREKISFATAVVRPEYDRNTL